MEDSFKLRIHKVFGSLSSSTTPSSSSLSSLWSLTDNELYTNQAEQNNLNQDEFSINFRTQMENDLNDLDEEDDVVSDDSKLVLKPKPDDYNDEQWDIKSSIGLDETLDNEEEEDEYDKVAAARDKDQGDQFYVQDIDDYGIDIDSSNELPSSFKDVTRDPRANHAAAKIRLKEDAEVARKMDSLQVMGQDSMCEHESSLKSILKKRDDDNSFDPKFGDRGLECKSQKRVRFDPECKDEEMKDAQMETDSVAEQDGGSVYQLPPDYPSGVPDYMRNPSKYTRYTFDSSDVDEQSNKQAYMDFLRMLKASKTTDKEEDVMVELPKSVTFIPKKKGGVVAMVDNLSNEAVRGPLLRRDAPIGITVGDIEANESCPMEESEPENLTIKKTSSRRQGRQYRSRAKADYSNRDS